MNLATTLRPHRSHAFPFAVFLFPQLWFVNREMGIAIATTNRPVTAIRLQAVESAAAAVVVSFVAAIVIAAITRLVWKDSMPAWARLLFQPSNGALVIFFTLSVALGAYVLAGTLFTLPRWFVANSTPIGVILGWPLIAVYLGMFAMAIFTGNPSLAVQYVAVELGVALTATWMLLLSGFIATLVIPDDSGNVPR